MANKSGHNSFYTNGNSKSSKNNNNINVDWKRIRKIGMRIFKWAVFIFLAITTLWGCVQEFTIKTSQFLSQGMETYINSDEVLPNLYYLEESYGYASTTPGSEENTVEAFGDILYPTATNTQDGLIQVETSTVTYQNADQAIAFEETEQEAISNGDSVSILVDSIASSISIANIATINYLLLFDQQQILNASETQILIPFVGYENYDDEDNQSQKWYVDSDGDSTLDQVYRIFDDNQTKNYIESTGEDLTQGDAKRINVINQALFYTNYFGFVSGTSITPDDVVLKDSNNQDTSKTLQTLIDDQIDSGFDNSLLQTYYFSNYDSTASYQTIDWETILGVDGGVSYYVVPPTRRDNYKPSRETYDWLFEEDGMDSVRDPEWESQPTSEKANNDFRDPTITNAGWLFMDTNGDVIDLYSSPTESTTFAAQTINEEFVASGSSATKISDIEAAILNGDYSTNYKETASINIDGEVLSMSFEEMIELNGFTSQEKLSGIQSIEYNQNYLVSDVFSSIDESGQQRYNNDRIAISSWGEAWTYGPFYGMFVYPISVIAQWLSSLFQWESIGAWAILLSIFIIVFVFRGLAALISLKSTRNQQKMQELQIKVAQINAKYEMYKDNKNMKQRKQMEVMALYKKENVSPFSSIGSIFLTLPIFLALWTIISTLPLYKVAAFGKFSLSVSPIYGIFNLLFVTAGLYLIVAILVGVVQYISFKVPNHLAQKRQGIKNIDDATKAQMKKNGRITTIMLVVFVIIGLTIPTLLAIYWVFSALFSIVLSLLQHYLQERKAKAKKEG